MAKRLFVGGVSWDTTNEGLKEFFTQAGEVISAEIVIDKYSGRGKGFGFVEMATEEGAEKAKKELNGATLDNRKLNVSDARPPEQRDNRSFGGGSRGGFDRRNDRRDDRRSNDRY